MKRIVLCGTTNAGKTTTLRDVIGILKARGEEIDNQSSVLSDTSGDCRVVIKIGDKVVGICTAGDTNKIVEDNERFLQENFCDIGIEAVRQNDKQWSLIWTLVSQFQDEVPLFIWKFPSRENNQLVWDPDEEKTVARQIVDIVMEVVR